MVQATPGGATIDVDGGNIVVKDLNGKIILQTPVAGVTSLTINGSEKDDTFTTAVGPILIGCGIVVTLTPVIVGYLFGHYILKLNPALLLGSITGSMTSTPSLNVVTEAAKSSIPALGYAGTYTFANVLLTFAGTVMMVI